VAGEGHTGPADPPKITLSTGGGAIRGIGEKFAANAVTGTGSVSLPISVSTARNGIAPDLSLSYDSGRGDGLFGFGWDVTLPSITRRTAKGLPRYTGEDVFVFSDTEDLVPVLDADSGWTSPPVTVDGYRVERFRPRIDTVFARIERWTRLVDGDVHWRSTTKDNITSWYGIDANSRVADPHHPERVFSWLICRTHDPLGNAVRYEYAAENGAGVDVAAAHERHRAPLDRTAARHLR
jgi:virulence plasmid B protein